MRNIACDQRDYRVFVDGGEMMDANKARALLIDLYWNTDQMDTTANISTRDIQSIISLITRQQAVCDAAKEFTDRYTELGYQLDDSRSDIVAEKLRDALKRLEDKP